MAGKGYPRNVADHYHRMGFKKLEALFIKNLDLEGALYRFAKMDPQSYQSYVGSLFVGQKITLSHAGRALFLKTLSDPEHWTMPQKRRWTEGIHRINSKYLPLVGPNLCELRDGLPWHLSLFGDDILPDESNVGNEFRPLKEYWREAMKEWQRCGVSLGDVPQFKVIDGIPFICDFSDVSVELK